jgi:hypothetical protein
LARLLADRGRFVEALGHCTTVLGQDAGNAGALTLLQRCSAALAVDNAAGAGRQSRGGAFDWSTAEEEVADIIQPAFVEAPADVISEDDFDVVQNSPVRLADVAGMAAVKQQLELSLLGPIHHPELMKAYKVSARGGLLLYGPLAAPRPTTSPEPTSPMSATPQRNWRWLIQYVSAKFGR